MDVWCTLQGYPRDSFRTTAAHESTTLTYTFARNTFSQGVHRCLKSRVNVVCCSDTESNRMSNVTSPEDNSPLAQKGTHPRRLSCMEVFLDARATTVVRDSVLDSCHTARRTLDF